MGIGLLHGVVGPHADVDRHDVALAVGEFIGRAGKVRGSAVDGEDMSRHVVAGSHSLENLRVAGGDRSECRTTAGARRGDQWDGDVVDHPPFIPATLVVDDEQRGDVGEHVVEGTWIIGIGRKPGLGLQDHTHGANRREPAVPSGDRQLNMIVHAGDDGREDIGFEAGRVQQVILEQLARPVRFGKRLDR